MPSTRYGVWNQKERPPVVKAFTDLMRTATFHPHPKPANLAIIKACELMPFVAPYLDSYIKTLPEGTRGAAGRGLTLPIEENKDVKELYSTSHMEQYRAGIGASKDRKRRRLLSAAKLSLNELITEWEIYSIWNSDPEAAPKRNERRVFTDLEVRTAMVWQQHRCIYCLHEFSERLTPVGEHIVPYLDNGPTVQSNCVASCVQCNEEKRDRPVLQYLMEFYSKIYRQAQRGRPHLVSNVHTPPSA